MFRSTLAALTLAALSSATLAQGVWPDDPWTDLRAVSVTSSFANGRTVILDADVLYSFGLRNRTPGDDDTADGFLQIYDRTTRGWLRRPRMVNPGIQASRNFGLAADIRGDLVAVGSPDDRPSSVPGEKSPLSYGYVRLMRLAPDGQSWSPEQLLVNADVPGPDQPFFGGAVRFLADDLLAVGSPREAIDGVVFAGAVHLYRFNGAEWAHAQRLTVDPDQGRVFGRKIQYSAGDLIITASGGKDFNTAVYIFRENEQGDWVQVQRIPWPDGGLNGQIDAFDDTLVLGSPDARTPLGFSGAIDIYRRGDGVWLHEATVPPEAGGFDPLGLSFGSNVAIHRDIVAAATSGLENGVIDTVVQIFERRDGEWTYTTQIWPSDRTDEFGAAMDMDADRVAIGDLGFDLFGPRSGCVFIVTRDAECFRDLRGDANNDGVTNFGDLNIVLTHFGQTGEDLPGDVTRDGAVDMTDLNVVLALFGSPCIPPL